MEEVFILVIEDDPDHAALIKAVLTTGLANTRVHLAFTGLEARLYLTGQRPYDDRSSYPLPTLIILDVRLPDTTGFEILEWLAQRKHLVEIPVIIFTSSSDPEHAKRAYSLGARRYFQKPADFGELVRTVKEVLGHGPSVLEVTNGQDHECG